ncbi:Crp/Fnr family transcriptional regulator [Sunxiuqinia sp. A32]|uniref:Crp/Fnr family transcriptional regulator n=1 Tax=Sunxiuqinia sp. A32 TaxID=3461496 RepID=UPI0040452C43
MKKHNCSCEQCQLKSLFFSHVTEEFLDTICTNKQEKNYEKGEIIISEGDPILDFIYLKSGLVKLSRKNGEEKDQIISFAKPFDFVSLLSVFSSDTYNYSVTAIEESVTCVLDLQEVKDMAQKNGQFALDMMNRISSATDRIILDNMEIKKKHLRGRIAYILLYFSKTIYHDNDFALPVSRREIAEYIGMTTENVIRTLSEFRKDKILKIYGKEIEIIDMKRLEDISTHG